MRKKFLSLWIAVLTVGACGVDNYSGVRSCGVGIPCGDVYSEDLLISERWITIDAIEQYLANKKVDRSPFKTVDDGVADRDDLLWGLATVQNIYGINPIFALSLSIHESGWGRSNISRRKKNLWGWNAKDSCPARCAKEFTSYRDGFNTVFARIKRNYLSEGGRYYRRCGDNKQVRCASGKFKQAEACGFSLAGMNCSYASDSGWGKKIRQHMNGIITYINNNVEIEDSCDLETP